MFYGVYRMSLVLVRHRGVCVQFPYLGTCMLPEREAIRSLKFDGYFQTCP